MTKNNNKTSSHHKKKDSKDKIFRGVHFLFSFDWNRASFGSSCTGKKDECNHDVYKSLQKELHLLSEPVNEILDTFFNCGRNINWSNKRREGQHQPTKTSRPGRLLQILIHRIV